MNSKIIYFIDNNNFKWCETPYAHKSFRGTHTQNILNYFLAFTYPSYQHNVSNDPNTHTVNTITALSLVHGIIHIKANDTNVKNNNDTNVIIK